MQEIYEVGGASLGQRFTLATAGALCAAAAWWLLLGHGIGTVALWTGHTASAGDLARRICLGAALTIYFIRILFTQFVFLRRGGSWSEAFTIVPWVFCITVWLCLAGGTNGAPLGIVATAGIVLFVAGSWMNSGAEYARHYWKQRAENQGKLYTLGWFRLTRHPNYCGDLISFSGLALIAGRWNTAMIPALMLAGFVFVNVPALDRHLKKRYGAAFDEWARRTRKLIPFVY
ncbi:MAG TPA: DUF1295 domain-containing protein [Acidobacteriaceae bacterium]|jgi:protein-S-isoprenylcysteine O-methyltransferase Ste14|nr:DUF1295 domain-containing protein [Acidobacteriaceae bacterium]